MQLCLSVAVYANNDIKEYMWFCYSLIHFFTKRKNPKLTSSLC